MRSFAGLLLLVGSIVAAPTPNPMPAPPRQPPPPPNYGDIRMVKPANTVGGVQLGGNHIPHPHIVVGQGPGHQEYHVAPVSHTHNQAFQPHMPTTNMGVPGLSGNIHLGHVTVQQHNAPLHNGNLRGANVGQQNANFINQRKQAEHTAAHRNAAQQHTNAASAHQQAQRAHLNAANQHGPTPTGQHHQNQANAHGNQANFHGQQAQGHHQEASNPPSHNSITTANNSAQNAHRSAGQAQQSAQNAHGSAQAARNAGRRH